MKILVVSIFYDPEAGAAPSRITNMAEGLQKAGAEVDVLTALPNYPKGRIFDGYRGCFSKKEVRNGVNVYRYWTYATVTKNPLVRLIGMFSFAISMWAFAFKRKLVKSYDKVIIQSPPLPVAMSALVLFKCLYGKTTVLNISDLWPLSAVELGAVKEGSMFYRVMAAMERFNYKHATMIQGQSQEIIDHVRTFQPEKKCFLYRNLQHDIAQSGAIVPDRKPFRVVYAGLLGVAQNILGLVQHINFKELNAEFHIYGGGNQAEAITEYIRQADTGVVYHGTLPKEELRAILPLFHASIVPLTVRIYGAVPSKIFDLLPAGVPILFCGGGEGANIVENFKIGLTSDPGDYEKLKENVKVMASMSDEQYGAIRERCLAASKEEFSFDSQMKRYYEFLNK